MLQRYGDFWSDALVALSLSPYTKQMELVTKLVEKRIEQVRRNADPRQKNRTTSEAAVKNWREDSRAALKRAEDFLLLQAIIDQQNDNKINRLMAFYRQIAQLRKERLVEGDKPKVSTFMKQTGYHHTFNLTFDNCSHPKQTQLRRLKRSQKLWPLTSLTTLRF